MRRARFKADPLSPVAYYHCVSRVVNRELVFGPTEKEHFVRTMRQYARFCGLRIVTYCVMSNHFHILAQVPQRPEGTLEDAEFLARLDALDRERISVDARQMLERLREGGHHQAAEEYKASFQARMWDISIFMKLVKQRFTQWFNRRVGRRGTLWEERFKSVLVQSAGEALATMAAYIDLNPIRAKLVEDVDDYYRWCGYAAALAGDREAQEGLTIVETARAAHVEESGTLRGALENYRVWLFGKGEQREAVVDELGTVEPVGKAGIDPRKVAEVREKKGRLTRWELLRCRVRYFTDGVALGEKAWVESIFALRRAWFGPRRKTGARPLRGMELPELRTMRDLQVRVVGG
jgi:hypothetical protein